MPGKIKVKVLAGRNLPVMDRAGDTTDAFVEIKFGGVTHKTDVCRKSLNPHWNSTEWYRFEVDESELQDEPLQLRLMDHDTYSANDAIGKVVISLAPLLAREANNAKGIDAHGASREECARAAAVIRWVLKQTWVCGCAGSQLTRDLLVLGVPRAHAVALADAADEGRGAYEAHVRSNGFKVNKVTDASVSPGPEGTVDTIKLTLHTDDVFTGEQDRKELLIDKSQVKLLVDELKKAYKKMEEFDAV